MTDNNCKREIKAAVFLCEPIDPLKVFSRS
jgi:hypothetical protein